MSSLSTERENTRRIILVALFAALACVATMVVQIPSPLGGYVNLGDCIVLISAWLLGPLYGALAAGIGSAGADLITGYVVYAPATLVIKAAMALIAHFSLRLLPTSRPYGELLRYALAALIAEAAMVTGYFLYGALLLGGAAAALLTIPGNAAQGLIGAAAAVALIRALDKLPAARNLRV